MKDLITQNQIAIRDLQKENEYLKEKVGLLVARDVAFKEEIKALKDVYAIKIVERIVFGALATAGTVGLIALVNLILKQP